MSTDPKPRDRGTSSRDIGAFGEKDQKVFDTVVGPNLRLVDNLIQLVVIVAGAALGALVGAAYARSSGFDVTGGTILGGLAGTLLALFSSGAVIGLWRAVGAMRKR